MNFGLVQNFLETLAKCEYKHIQCLRYLIWKEEKKVMKVGGMQRFIQIKSNQERI